MLKIKKFKPMFTSMLVTGEKYSEDMYDNYGLIECKKGDLKTYQKVLEVGPSVRDIKVGDMVMINIMHFAVMEYDPNSVKNDMGMNKIKKWNFNWVTVNDQDCLVIDQQDVMFGFEGEEVQGVKNLIIVPKEKKIILES